MTRHDAGAVEALGLWAARAGVAERAVRSRHLRRVWGVPGTRLGMAGWPARAGDRGHLHWNYWWQAHLLDCLVDAQQRAPGAERAALIRSLVRGVRLRNFGRWTNDYYDDVAWLGLALLRAAGTTGLDAGRALAEITAQLREGWTDHSGGGIWWRRKDDFKNVPANGPAAILLARAQLDRADRQRARSTVEWIDRRLLDPDTGLLWDGLHVRDDGTITDYVTTTYTYCQGVYLGACVELARDDPDGEWVRRAARTIRVIDSVLAVDGVLPGQGDGDGGLFAGILARYLAQAALRLPAAEGDLARSVVLASAEAAWRNRAVARGGPVFGPEWARPADTPLGPRDRRPERHLSVQLSGWMVLEAAALLERASMAP